MYGETLAVLMPAMCGWGGSGTGDRQGADGVVSAAGFRKNIRIILLWGLCWVEWVCDDAGEGN